MRIALTGASGFIGSVIARHLSDAGHLVTALVRATSRRDHIEPHIDRFVVGDHAQRDAWPDLLQDADAVVHNSADWRNIPRASEFSTHLQSNLVGSLELLKASAPCQFIFMSTIAVHHDMRPAAHDVAGRGLIDENHPLRPGSAYGAYKASVETHLWAEVYGRRRNCSAIRPCAVYGQDPNLERTIGHPIVKAIATDRKYTKPGGGKFVHVDDIAQIVVKLIGNAETAGGIYNLADCYARWGDWAKMTADALDIDDAEFDLSGPAEPKNIFTKDAAQSLGVQLDRGHDGIRKELTKLVQRMRDAGEIPGS